MTQKKHNGLSHYFKYAIFAYPCTVLYLWMGDVQMDLEIRNKLLSSHSMDRAAADTTKMISSHDSLLRSITQDGVVTNEELVEYGLKTNLVEIISKEKKEAFRKEVEDFHNSLRNPKKANTDMDEEDKYRGFTKITVDSVSELSMDHIIRQANEQDNQYVVFVRTDPKPKQAPAVFCLKKDLLAIDSTFKESKKKLGLKNIALSIQDNSGAYCRVGNASIHLALNDLRDSPESCNFTIGHELGHMAYYTHHSAAFIAGRKLIETAKSFFGQVDRFKEDEADRLASTLRLPGMVHGVYETFIGSFYVESKTELTEWVDDLSKINHKDEHSPNAQRVKTMMLLQR